MKVVVITRKFSNYPRVVSQVIAIPSDCSNEESFAWRRREEHKKEFVAQFVEFDHADFVFSIHEVESV